MHDHPACSSFADGGGRTAILAQQLRGATNREVKLRTAKAIQGLRNGGAGIVAHLPAISARARCRSDIERLAKFVEDPRIRALLARKEDFAPSAKPFWMWNSALSIPHMSRFRKSSTSCSRIDVPVSELYVTVVVRGLLL